MDPLSDVLSMLKPNGYGFRRIDAGGSWALGFAASEGMKCYAIESGDCRLGMDGEPDLQLSAGDLVLLPTGRAFRLFGDRDAPVIDARVFLQTISTGGTGTLNGGGDCVGVGGHFSLDGLHARRLLAFLPAVMHLGDDDCNAALRWLIDRLMRELREPRPGSDLLAEHLIQSLLIEALRLHLTEDPGRKIGWLFALADGQMHAVISAMHANPARKWTLHDFAQIAGMSRSGFAARFKATVGEPAMDYLTRWRMLLAASRLSHTDGSISAIAPTVGYQSESAFGAAFKRIIGTSPRRFHTAAR